MYSTHYCKYTVYKKTLQITKISHIEKVTYGLFKIYIFMYIYTTYYI